MNYANVLGHIIERDCVYSSGTLPYQIEDVNRISRYTILTVETRSGKQQF